MLIRALVFLSIFFHSALNSEPAIPGFAMPVKDPPVYESPTSRYIKRYPYEQILQSLRSRGLKLEHRNFFEHLLPHEELGFFGYHSSTQGYRIFQDIIRIVLEEVCGFEIREDFHFLRVPGNPLLNQESAQSFLEKYRHINNGVPEQQEQLLSMNYALFGNFNNFGSCSVYYFTENRSATSVGFQNKLRPFFENLGIPVEKIEELFAIGGELMSEENAVLLQFFDFSHHNAFFEPYALVDRMCYTALPGGAPQNIGKKMAEIYLGKGPSPFTAQFRLVINNSTILNPNTPLVIKRYDRVDPEIVEKYETKLRQAVRELPFDAEKRDLYRLELMSLWGENAL